MTRYEEFEPEAERPYSRVREIIEDRMAIINDPLESERGSLGTLFRAGLKATPIVGTAVTAAEAGAASGNFFWRNKGKIAIAGASGVALVSSLVSASSFEGTADLSAAHTAANVYKIEFDKNTAITPGTVYMQENYTATDIEYKFTARVCFGICHDFHSPSQINPRVNKMIQGGIGQEEIIVPLTAIKAYKHGDGIDVVVDKAQEEGHLAWSGGAPTVVNFTGDANNPNLADANGTRDQFFKVLGEIPGIVNLDGPKKAYTDLDQKVNHDVSVNALGAMGDCNQEPAFERMVDKQVEAAVRATINSIDGTPDIVNFSFTHPTATIKVDTGQRAEAVLGGSVDQAEYQLDGGKPTRDLTLCAGDKLPTS
jgi:ribosomal protein L21E